jgi:2',3'-cyclic-nucleotide 2'-phosphodiesterase (5'-nucleotidase family)
MVMPDPEVAAVVAKFEDELNKELDAPIGTTAVELDSRAATVRTREAAIGNLVADAMRWSAQTEVAVTNGGSIRGDKIYPPGTTITRREVLAELPFGNRLVTIDVRGDALKAAIENGLSRLPAPSGRFPQVAGLKIEADPSRPAGNRVLSIKVGDTPLDANKTYSVATIDFMARGGGRLHQLPRCQAGPAARRLADHCLRDHRLHKEYRDNTHRRRWADRIELRTAFSDLKNRGRLVRRESM